jgi:GR25 family glycosyltransferase involved in LPS biosynthesis
MINLFLIFLIFLIIFIILYIIFYLINININFENFENLGNLGNLILENSDIYVINLDNDIDRWNNLIKNSNINLIRISAINGNNINKELLIEENILDKSSTIKIGQIGCALSHLKAWKESLKNNKPFLIVLEDDVIIDNNIINKIDDLGNYLPKEWDIIFLGGCNVYGKKFNEKLLIPTINNMTYNLCCHAMLINKKSVNKLLNIMTPLQYPIDNQLRNNYDNLNVFYSYPNLINQNKELISVRRVIDGLPQSEYWKENHKNMTII